MPRNFFGANAAPERQINYYQLLWLKTKISIVIVKPWQRHEARRLPIHEFTCQNITTTTIYLFLFALSMVLPPNGFCTFLSWKRFTSLRCGQFLLKVGWSCSDWLLSLASLSGCSNSFTRKLRLSGLPLLGDDVQSVVLCYETISTG